MSYEITFQKSVSEYPVSVEEAKQQLQMTSTEFEEQDSYIEALIKAVTKEAESFLNADIAYTLNTYNLYDFSSDKIKINEGNYKSLVSIVTDASASIEAAITFPYYTYFKIELNSSVTSDPLQVKFYTGYTKSECPENLKLAIKMRVKDYYDHQRGSLTPLQLHDTKAFERLINSCK